MPVASEQPDSSFTELRSPGSASTLGVYVERLWAMRSYAWASARHGLDSATAGTALGRIWLLLEPAILIAIYYVVFGVVLEVDRGTENFIAFLAIGQIFFGHSRLGISQASLALVSNAPILRSFSFPRAVLPLSQVLRAFANFRFNFVVLAIFVVIVGVDLRISWLWLVPLAALQVMMNFGIGLLLTRPITRFADLRKAMPYMFQVLFYASGVFFPLDRFVGDRSYGPLMLDLATLNPLYSVIHLARWSMMGTEPASSGLMVVSVIAWTLLSVGLGLVIFVQGERSYSGVRTVQLTG